MENITGKYSKVWRYNVVLKKTLKKATDNDFLVTYDDNGYYCTIPERRLKGRYLQHEIDLERYRFEAWQDLAIAKGYKYAKVKLPNADLNAWALSCAGMNAQQALEYFKKKRFNNQSLFCEFYHIKVKEIELWTYDEWRKYYERTPKIELSSRFKFTFGVLPGTENCHKEWLEDIKNRQRDKELELEAEKNKKSWEAKANYFKNSTISREKIK